MFKHMKKNRRTIGSGYERLAGKYLETMGYEILEYNFRCRTGEIDIVAREGEYLVFCEVKYRCDGRKGDPLEAVTPAKQRKISQTAMYYIAVNRRTDVPCRFDVIGILGNKIQIIKNAFDYIG